VDALAALAPGELDDGALGALVVEVVALRDQLDGICARLIAEHDERQGWRADGARSEQQWLAQRCRWSPGEAANQAETARRLALLPQTQAAFANGDIGPGHARTAVKALRDLPPDAREGLDALVAEQGPQVDAAQLRRAVDDHAHRVDAGSLAAREERAWQRRRLRVGRGADGDVILDGRLDPIGGETVLTAVAALAAPSGEGDLRSCEQRQADALVTLAGRALDDNDLPVTAGNRPHVTVVVDLDTLRQRRGADAATLDRLGRISGDAARQLACDADVTRVLTDAASLPLDVGRAHRVVTPAQRRALAVRDRGCVGCGAPAGWCQAHHVQHWADGGPTDLDNLVLVCHGCHRDIHVRGHHPTRGPDGRWRLPPPASPRCPQEDRSDRPLRRLPHPAHLPSGGRDPRGRDGQPRQAQRGGPRRAPRPGERVAGGGP
jgi:hypothetical protein